MITRLLRLAGGMVGMGEAVVCAGLLVFVADRAGQDERASVLRARTVGLAGRVEHLTAAV